MKLPANGWTPAGSDASQMATLKDDKSVVARHRSLAAALQWSFDLLTEVEQQVLMALSLFATDFDLAADDRVRDLSGRLRQARAFDFVERLLLDRRVGALPIVARDVQHARTAGHAAAGERASTHR